MASIGVKRGWLIQDSADRRFLPANGACWQVKRLAVEVVGAVCCTSLQQNNIPKGHF